MSKKREYKDCGLIGKLYWNIITQERLKKIKVSMPKIVSPLRYFEQNWLGITKRPHDYWSDMAYYGTFKIGYYEYVKSYIENQEKYEKTIQSEIDKIKKLNDGFDEDIICDKLVTAIDDTKDYINDDGFRIIYNENAKQRLINHINDDRELFSLPHFIRHYIRFALYKTVPEDFSENERTKRDLDVFSECSIRKFGTTSKHGIMEIIRLAEREEKPNIIAMCEYADILYYGQVDGIEQNIPEAFRLYKKAAGIDEENSEVSENSELHKNAYPQALWSVGHIIFNYSNNRFNSALPKHDPIPEIEELDNLERNKLAYKRASQAYSISQLPAAANLLGQIAQLTDDDCNGIDEFKKKKRIKDAQFYFEIAKDGGWIYAFNNLALEELKEMTNEIGCVQKRDIHIYNCLKNLHEAAIRFEPWAANLLGLYYLEGIKYRDPNTKKVKTIIDSEGVRTIGSDGTVLNYDPSVNYKIINPYTNQEEIVDSIIDPDRAFFYFMKAYKAYHIFHDRYCGWACANLKSCFSERLSKEELIDIEAIINKYSHIDGILKTANKKRQLPTIKHKKLR